MYCPKCKQTFEEGSRRFCPTDGARLISDDPEASVNQRGGIFANLIPKIDALSDLEQPLPELRQNPRRTKPNSAYARSRKRRR